MLFAQLSSTRAGGCMNVHLSTAVLGGGCSKPLAVTFPFPKLSIVNKQSLRPIDNTVYGRLQIQHFFLPGFLRLLTNEPSTQALLQERR